MPLQQIAYQIITLADKRGSTPVLVTPPYLSFRKQFFVELSRELAAHTDRDLRIDWYRNLPGVRTIISDQLAAWHVKSVNRLLERMSIAKANQLARPASNTLSDKRMVPAETTAASPQAHNQDGSDRTQTATVQITAAIARPGGKTRDLVVGLSDVRQCLPEWTTAIRLGASREEIERWQAA